ncbi:GntR family transcriptional regulator [Litoribacillus peritrichatus]|uniref:GntR family transcriptional regulator n=1 Tax=Litoribacillus peritrichatus TaxID=718191 RepID=A0ABP7M8A9_9GAMM
MSFKVVESLSEQIATHLASKIIRGEIKPGERIQELRIAGELDVSRGSVREALLILERRHLVDIIPRRGAVVTEITRSHVENLYEVYGELLELLAVKVTENWSGADLDPLIKKFEVMRAAKIGGEHLERIFELGFEIMEQAYSIAKNVYLMEVLINFKPVVQRTYYLALKSKGGDFQDNVAFFEGIMESVVTRNKEKSAQLVRSYVDTQKLEVLKTLDD